MTVRSSLKPLPTTRPVQERGTEFILVALLAGMWLGQAVGADAILRARIFDGTSGGPTACTVTITDAQGKVVTESASFRDGFRCSGEFTKSLPPGQTRIRITRGFETKALEQEVNLAAGETKELALTLQRVTDLRKLGWYAGDSHAHMLHGERTVPVSFDFVALTARAEDLQYLSLAQAWSLDDPTPERLEAELKKRSTRDCMVTWNLEAPKNYYRGDAGRCLGHCWNAGLRGRTPEGHDVIRMLLEASAWDYESDKPTYANFESHQLIHDQGGVACYSHPARWWMGSWGGQGGYPKVDQMRISNMAVELPLDTLLGPTYDGIDIITGSGEFEANAKAFAIWSLLLNHGYRIAATGSSDSCFDRPGGGVPGTPRLYTFVPGKFSVAKAARAIAAGKTIVTTGPLLIATVDGEPPGAAFPAGAKSHRLSVEAWASGRSKGGLQKVEILRNGQPWREWACAGKPDRLQTNLNLVEHETAWYCVRVSGTERQIAVSSAFYFADASCRRPEPVRAQVKTLVLDAQTGKPIPAVLTELTFSGTAARVGKRHTLPTGEARLSIPGTARLRAEAKGYASVTLSPFLDSPGLVKTVTTLKDEDLANWETYERLKRQLENVELVFRLPKAAHSADASTPPKRVNVIVINFDPVVQTRQNRKLHEYQKWSDPWQLTDKMIEDARVTSHGYVDYKVVERIEYNGFPRFRNGFSYTEAAFLEMWEKDRSKADKGMTSFAWLFKKFDLPAKIKALNVSEIWLWGAPYFAWDELHWKTPRDKIPYQTDNPWFYRPYDIPDVGRTVWIMGWNYERGEGEMLESYCHRIESVLSLTVGKGVWDPKRIFDNPWNRFSRVDKDFPGQSEVGTVHYAPNSLSDYDWSNTNKVWTFADDWLTYPKLPREKKLLNATTGGWDGIIHHHKWWMTHIPHEEGQTDGFYNNWWEYIVNYDEAIRNLPPPKATFQKAKVAMYAE